MAKSNRLALNALKEIDFSKNRYNLVAIIERGGKIISIGTNNMHNKTHPSYFNGDFDKALHAEFAALRAARDVKGANIHVFRFRRDGTLGNSKPCENCLKELNKRGIKRVQYYHNNTLIRERL